MTAEEQAQVAFDSRRSTVPIEPFASYTVGRARREFSNQSAVNLMMMRPDRNVGDERSPMRLLANSAYSGGIDWDLRLATQSLRGGWLLGGSAISSAQAAIARLQLNNVHSFQRPDSSGGLEFDRHGHAQRAVEASWRFARFRASACGSSQNIGFKSPGFDSGDLGFTRRPIRSRRATGSSGGTTSGQAHPRLQVQHQPVGQPNFDGDRLGLGGNINAHWQFKNNWSTGFGINRERGSFDDRATRGGPGANYEPSGSFWSYVNTDDRKPVAFDTFLGGGYSEFGPHFFDVNPGLTFAAVVAIGERRAPLQQGRSGRPVGDEPGGVGN